MLDEVLGQIAIGDLAGLDVKKLEGKLSRYRIRKGNIRIQFSLGSDRRATDIDVDWKDDATYRF
ncbi:MAG: hypothetical protein AAB767_01885 [Patescibacteria group bacterium]